MPLLGQIPLEVLLREGGDSGVPLVLGRPETPAAVALTGIAGRLASVPRGLKGIAAGAAAPADSAARIPAQALRQARRGNS
ncbi:Mrp/NBP35 family ATP-binding protein [Arthrobacter sp. NicSoilC12]|uniref:Mrp/NBP35 family ATP-binding protein n=1 Tax=Arthrobacter sp. NicSoilC12 TaxID=2831001 RepID=UPI001CC5656F|nr:hypothetical protein NicSoilC12_07170 [Arthrobacter sp. NicSoilC12]